MDHLMCRCRFIEGVWQLFLDLMGCHWVLESNVGEVMVEWVEGPYVGRRGVT